jgi:hypothetical protein
MCVCTNTMCTVPSLLYLSLSLSQCRACATANFGPSAPYTVRAQVSLPPPSDIHLCGPKASSDSVSGTVSGMVTGANGIPAFAQATGKLAEVVKSWWFTKLQERSVNTPGNVPSGTPVSSSGSSTSVPNSIPSAGVSQLKKVKKAVNERIVVAHRGSCMFEEKAAYIQGLGGKAVIIRNNEVRHRLL